MNPSLANVAGFYTYPESTPIPVVFNLASWGRERQSIAEWLLDELIHKYSIPKKKAQSWIQDDEMFLLLDGLDEVKQEYCEDCIQAINKFRSEHLVPLAICSRTEDYESLSARLRLQSAVLIQPLSIHQIHEYLEDMNLEFQLGKILQNDDTLLELLNTPLMLNIVALVSQGRPFMDLTLFESVWARRSYLIEEYIQRMFERRSPMQPYSQKQTVDWLKWLAQKMTQQVESIFLLERMQPWCLLSTNSRRQYHVYFPIIIMIIVTLYCTLVLGLILTNWSTKEVSLLGEVIFFLPFSQFVGSGLMIFLYFKTAHLFLIKPIEHLKWDWSRGLVFILITVSFFSLINAVLFGAPLGVLAGLVGGLSYTEINTKRRPNQGILWSAKNATLLFLFITVVTTTWWLLYLTPELVFVKRLFLGLIFGQMLGLIAGLYGGGWALIQHFALRFILWRDGQAPWNYAKFLDYCVDRILLRKVGSGYIFIHRVMMEHLAGTAVESAKKDSIWSKNSRLYDETAIHDFIKRMTIAKQKAQSHKSINIFKKAIVRIYIFRISRAYGARNLERIIFYCTKALELNSDSGACWNILCWCCSLSGNVADAIVAGEQAIKLSPDNGGYYDSRGIARALTGDINGAIEDFKFFVEWSKKKGGRYEHLRFKREIWLAKLETGENQFSETVLDELRFEL